MRDHKIHNKIAVRTVPNREQLGLYWTDEDGNNSTLIGYVFGFENAIRVAERIVYEGGEFVTHPCFNPDEEVA